MDRAVSPHFFSQGLAEADPEVMRSLTLELERQQTQIELIASENIVSRAVLEAVGSVLTNKYAEGYPGKRYYGGCEFVDIAETLAIERAKKLFNCSFANVQPHAGAPANEGVFLALLKPGDTIMGMNLASGGHLTHGAPPNISGKWFNAIQYGVRLQDGIIDFKAFRQIADSVGALLMVDMAHFAGLVAAGIHPSPLPIADVVTTTTHKTLRGPRGGMILSNSEEIGKKINSAIFPGLQGGPLMHVIAGKAVAFGEALKPEFKAYAQGVVDNAKALAERLRKGGLDIVSGGTDTHLMLVDLRPKKLTGNVVEKLLEHAGMTCNKNGIPFDPEKPTVTSGVRLGTPAATTRGFGTAEFDQIGGWICEVLDAQASNPGNTAEVEKSVLGRVQDLCRRFPIYQ
jgi:glycine hydroxymethyltransferase